MLAALPAVAQDGPSNHRVLLATSGDGLNWTLEPPILAEKASVPELFLNPEGRPTVLFVDASGARERIGAMEQDADGSWRRVEINLRGVDPNVVRLADGSHRAYVKARLDGAIAAYASKDGLDWEPRGEVFRDPRYPNATAPDVFETPDEWVMLVSLGPRLLRCTSRDGLSFTPDGTVLELGGWRTFFHVNPDPRAGAFCRARLARRGRPRTGHQRRQPVRLFGLRPEAVCLARFACRERRPT